MGRAQKLTKHVLLIALQTTGTVAGAARYLGVNRRTVQRTLKRLQLENVTPESPIEMRSDALSAASEPLPSQCRAEPEGNILRYSINDYTGSCRGDVGVAGSHTRSTDGLLARLKGW
jgi:hypothetical protein